MRTLLRLSLLLILTLAGLGLAGYWTWLQLEQPFGAGSPRIVQIPRGASSNRIAALLAESGLLESPLCFRLAQEYSPSQRPLQAGRYALQPPLSPFQLVEILRRGRTQQHRITLPEGLDLEASVSLLVAHAFGSRSAFYEQVHSPVLIQGLDPQADDLEGYLFPETYLFEVTADEGEIIRTMVAHARKLWTPQRREQARRLGMSIREVMTLASLIEKETGASQERPLVSSVFHNRLRRNMRLACDPTVIYAVKRVNSYDGIIHQSDLQLDSPYNTYLYPGLPPGPIANPGAASVDAALNPAPTEYLYFVSRNDGTHVFSRTYEEHARAVQKYQR